MNKLNCRLVVQSVGIEDGGAYTLTASNSVGETIATAKLNCHTEKPHFIKFPQDLTIHDYAEYETKVRAEGIPTPTLHWLKDGKPLNTDLSGLKVDFASGATDAQVTTDLSIKHFGKEHQGNVSYLILPLSYTARTMYFFFITQYAVVATNIAGETSAKFKLALAQLSPTFVKKLDKAAEVNQGDKLELKCVVDGSPLPKVAWYKDGQEIEANDR